MRLSDRTVAAAAVALGTTLTMCTAPSVQLALGAAAGAAAAVCDYTRNPGSYREAGPIQGGVPQPSGNLACHWGAKVPLLQFKSECDGEPRCVGFSYTAPATEGSEPPAEGEGCLKNNYDPHVWGHQPGFDGYDKGRWSTDWTHECLCTCSAWGVPLLLTFGLCGIAYVGLGILYGRTRHTRVSMSVRAHPHWSKWQEVYSLARDGMSFVRDGGKARAQRAGYTPVPRAPPEREGSSSGSKTERGPGGDAKAKRAKQDKKEERKERPDAPRPPSKPGHNPEDSCASPSGSAGIEPAAGKSVASGGGGRWVHIPG